MLSIITLVSLILLSSLIIGFLMRKDIKCKADYFLILINGTVIGTGLFPMLFRFL